MGTENIDNTEHKWGPWISKPNLWNGEGHRICSCGKIQWADNPDPHQKD